MRVFFAFKYRIHQSSFFIAFITAAQTSIIVADCSFSASAIMRAACAFVKRFVVILSPLQKIEQKGVEPFIS